MGGRGRDQELESKSRCEESARHTRQEGGEGVCDDGQSRNSVRETKESQLVLRVCLLFDDCKVMETREVDLERDGHLILSGRVHCVHQRKKISGKNQGSQTPHIKTYCRISANANLSWYLVTSHNLSKAAWGVVQLKKKPYEQLFIRSSYELGVLIYPDLFKVLLPITLLTPPR